MTTHRPSAALRISLVAAVALAAACGHSSGSSSSEATLTVALTDAASDDVASFTVGIASIQLTRARGGTVEVLAAPVSVDLATLQELSQIVNVTTVPPGFYTAASITLDFQGARCVLIGQTTPAALVDEDGNPLDGLVAMPLSLAGAPLRALGGRHRVLELDFDLDQSLTVDVGANEVTVAPTIVVRLDRSDPRELIAMGSLVSVDAATALAVVDLKTLDGTFLRRVEFALAAGAVYQIDGVPSVGTNGLRAFAAVPPGTWVQGYGAAHPSANRIDVKFLEAGAGTWNGGSDILEGHVIGRSGGAGMDATLTVLGRSQDATHSSFLFNAVFSVEVSFAGTKVVRRGDSAAYDTDELNVGQRVRIFGALSGLTMDATSASSVARAQPTRVLGFSIGAPGGGVLTMDLERVDLRLEGEFDWSQGGATPPDPLRFIVDVGSLADELGIVDGTPVVARGFFAAVDDADEDFVAAALVNRDRSPSLLAIRDRLLGFDVATSALPARIQFTITGAPGPGERAVIDHGFVGVEDLPANPLPTVVPAEQTVFFCVRDALTGAVRVERDFAGFSDAIDDAIAAGRRLFTFHAVGSWSAASSTLEATIATAVIR